MDKDLAITIGAWLCVLLMMYNYKRLNSWRNYSFLVVLYFITFLILKTSLKAATRDFAFLIVFILIYRPTRLLFKLILKREPIVNFRGQNLTEEEEEISSVVDYLYTAFLITTSIFFSAFYFWDKL